MKRIHLNAFKIAGVGHTAIGLWRHPDSQAHRYKNLDYWLETAKILEKGRFDSLFIADFPGIQDTYKRSADAALRDAIAVPLNDPLMTVSAMAAATEYLGFGLTVSTTYEQPYSFARKMTTLDHLTKGRVGWNIVTSVTESAARNLGLDKQVPHDERYAIADEFMDVVYKLWEGSWEDQAVLDDRRLGVFVDPSKVHPAAHAGKYFRVPDPFLCEPSIQRTPVLFQAGASAAGMAFAAKHAEVVFLVDPNVKGMAKLVKEIRALATERGRDPQSIKFMAGVSVVSAPTDAQAQAKFDDLISYISVEGTLARQSALMQLDFGSIDIDKPLKFVETDGIRSALERFTKGDPDRVWTPRQVAEKLAQSLGALSVVGSPATVADKLEAVMDEADIDGYNIYDHMPLRAMPEFVELVVPELQRRGRVPLKYPAKTLRENITGAHSARLAADHIGAQYGRNKRLAKAPERHAI
jgi:FMN-dependent oxidoreductase (nitrilotriacetate monooxygenase family)